MCIEHVYVYIIAISPVRFVYKIKYSMPNLDCSQCFMVLFFVCFFVVVVVCFLLLFCLKLKKPKKSCASVFKIKTSKRLKRMVIILIKQQKMCAHFQ